VSQESLTNKTLHGIAWFGSATTMQGILSLLLLTVFARLLTPEDFGIIGAALIVIGFAKMFSLLGVGPAIVQREELTSIHIKSGYTLSIFFGICTGIVTYISAPFIADFFNMDSLQSVIEILSIVFPLTAISVISKAQLQRELKFKIISIVQIASYIFGFAVIGLILAILGYGVWALVFANLGQTAFNSIVFFYIRRNEFGISLQIKEAGQLLNYGAGQSMGSIGHYFAGQADNIIVGRFMGADALGVYGRAYQFLMMPANLIGNVFDKVLFPSMASVQNNKSRLTKAYSLAIGVIAMVTIPISAFLIVFAEEFVFLLLGDQWGSVIIPFQILAGVLVFRTSYKVSDSLARAIGVVYQRAWRQWIYVLFISLFAYVGHFWGLPGVAVGVGFAIILNFILMLQLSIKYLHNILKLIAFIHLRHICIGCMFGIISIISKAVLIQITSSYLLILISGIIINILFLLLLYIVDRRIFGHEGEWLFSIINERMSRFI
jgi:O-antigen/teichoic acid export membrane protein